MALAMLEEMRAMMRSSGDGTNIDVATLEKMARVARGFPGRTVSIAPDAGELQKQWHERRTRSETARCVLHIDGVVAAELVERYLNRS